MIIPNSDRSNRAKCRSNHRSALSDRAVTSDSHLHEVLHPRPLHEAAAADGGLVAATLEHEAAAHLLRPGAASPRPAVAQPRWLHRLLHPGLQRGEARAAAPVTSSAQYKNHDSNTEWVWASVPGMRGHPEGGAGADPVPVSHPPQPLALVGACTQHALQMVAQLALMNFSYIGGIKAGGNILTAW